MYSFGLTVVDFGGFLVLLCLKDIRRLTGPALILRPVSVLGYYSYPFYLFHINAKLILRSSWYHVAKGPLAFSFILLSFLFGYCGMSFVDHPIRTWWSRRKFESVDSVGKSSNSSETGIPQAAPQETVAKTLNE